MNNDEFDRFIFHDAIGRCGLKPRDACIKVDYHASWIHHAIVRLKYAESDAELRATQQEIEQDIRNIQTGQGWNQQMMSAFHERWQAALTRSPEAGSAGIPKPAGLPAGYASTVQRPGWLAWLGM